VDRHQAVGGILLPPGAARPFLRRP
jgi:hypothetical protein